MALSKLFKYSSLNFTPFQGLNIKFFIKYLSVSKTEFIISKLLRLINLMKLTKIILNYFFILQIIKAFAPFLSMEILVIANSALSKTLLISEIVNK
jgi:hypothetical protein